MKERGWREKSSIGLLDTVVTMHHKIRVYKNRLAIWRTDGQRMTWEELQLAKQQIWGDRVAIEVYPAQKDVVNLRHTRHLWSAPLIDIAVSKECRHEEFGNEL